MDKTTLIYIVFCGVIFGALLFDLGLISRKGQIINLRTALVQTLFWVLLSFVFCGFIWLENAGGNGQPDALAYLSAYFLEWSLSIDNIFVFIIIFSYFKVKESNFSRVLLSGIGMAILFRILFIAIGTTLVARFSWIMYIFGAFLVYTGIKLFRQKEEAEFDPGNSTVFRLMKKYLRTTDEEPHGKFILIRQKKGYFTKLALVVVMLGLIDLVFALDSIPAVFSVIPDPSKKLLIYSSNIFAVLGLRSLFFLLRGAANKFDYLQQGIAVVLLFIGLKMLAEFFNVHIPIFVSLTVILVCISASILYSTYNKRKGAPDPDV